MAGDLKRAQEGDQVRLLLLAQVLIAGPCRSGTGDAPGKLAANVAAMEALALPIFRAGHVPVVGEWLALPLCQLAGSARVGDAVFQEVFHPIAERLLEHCDGVLRTGGASQGRDLMVATPSGSASRSTAGWRMSPAAPGADRNAAAP